MHLDRRSNIPITLVQNVMLSSSIHRGLSKGSSRTHADFVESNLQQTFRPNVNIKEGVMSLGYAEKLSYKEDVGTVGMSEIFEPSHVLDEKIAELALLIQKSKHLVAFTGAGISTSCGIPDFRGPKGIWTLQREGKSLPEASLPFHRAMPSLTHMALVELERIGILKYVISQNVDCLHLRSGIPREKLSELHGNSFREICPSCGTEYIRDFEIETIGMKQTPRRCSEANCNTKLRDTVLDWEDALPSKEMDPASKQCRKADLVLCLGTSLQIIPACNLPLKAIRGGGKVVIVNLQETPKDNKASLVIHGQVDKVIAAVMQILNFRIPPYIRIDFVRIIFGHARKYKTSMQWTLNIQSIHGTNAPLPFIKSIEVYTDQNEEKNVLLEKQPFCLKRQARHNTVFKIFLKFNLSEGCGCSCTIIEWPVDFSVENESISPDRNEILQKLRDKAESENICGQNSILERKVLPKSETNVVAIVTNIFKYNMEEKSSDASIKKFDADDDDEIPSKRLKQS